MVLVVPQLVPEFVATLRDYQLGNERWAWRYQLRASLAAVPAHCESP
jgi:hypothetical protein